METTLLTFTLNGIDYCIDPHIWTAYPDRVGLITVERIVEPSDNRIFRKLKASM